MSRYIDAEYVNAFPIRIDHYDEEHGNRHFVLGIESVMEYIEEAPSIDIVRCKDCKWCLVEEGGCERIGMVLFADEIENHFCGYGEVRDE